MPGAIPRPRTSPSGRLRLLTASLLSGGILTPLPAIAADGIDSGDTAWILVSTALVLFMPIPGLALFYSGLVRTKNVPSVLMQCFALTALMTIVWLVCGYSLAFDATGMEEGVRNLSSFVGGLGKAFLIGVDGDTARGSIPEVLFFCFQMTFAIITPALIVGTFAERMRFSAVLVSRRRVRGRPVAEDQARDRRARRPGRGGPGGDRRRIQHRQDRRRQDLREGHRGGDPHPHRGARGPGALGGDEAAALM
jgi:hypothetical protein